jgi:hypothetical protein
MDYSIVTNFTAKDALASGNPAKIIKGSEFGTEFSAIASAIATKADSASPELTGTPTAPTAPVDTSTPQIATTAYVVSQGYLKIAAANTLYAPKASPAFTGMVTGVNSTWSGTVTAAEVTLSSDSRKKEQVRRIESALALVQALDGVRFKFKASGRDSVGFIAQEVREVLPELVHEDGEGFLSVAYANVTAVLVEAVKELAAEVRALKEAKEAQ